MIYIKYTKDYNEAFDENNNYPKIIKKCIFKLKAFLGKFFIKKVSNGELIILPTIKLNLKKNLLRFFRIYSIKTICISNELEENNFLKNENLNILSGKWLYKYLLVNILKYIFESQERNPKEQEVSFLINKITEIDLVNIEKIAKYIKVLNVITESTSRIKCLADKLYKENGIIINITKNYKKSLLKSSVIINIDFSEEELNKYTVPRRAIILNIGNKVKINYKGFEGVNIFDYNICLPKIKIDENIDFNCFRKEVLYESVLYKNTIPSNILSQIDKDNIHIESLVGQKGIIRKQEFSK